MTASDVLEAPTHPVQGLNPGLSHPVGGTRSTGSNRHGAPRYEKFSLTRWNICRLHDDQLESLHHTNSSTMQASLM